MRIAKTRTNNERKVKCKNCGKGFVTTSLRQKYCSDCKAIIIAKQNKESYERRKERLTSGKLVPEKPSTYTRKATSNKELLECVRRADKLGMSYGNYIASLYEK